MVKLYNQNDEVERPSREPGLRVERVPSLVRVEGHVHWQEREPVGQDRRCDRGEGERGQQEAPAYPCGRLNRGAHDAAGAGSGARRDLSRSIGRSIR